MRPFPFGARPARRPEDNTGTSADMPRALLSVSDKTGIDDVARGLAARGFELVSTGGTARALPGGRPDRDERVGRDGLPGNARRPRQDAAPDASWRHPRAPRSSRRSRGARRARRRPRRRRHRQPLSVCRGRGQSVDDVRRAGRGNRYRRAVDGARGGQELPARARRRRSGGLRPRCSTALDQSPSLAFRFELARKAHRAHGVVRHRHHRRAWRRDASGIDVRARRARSAAVTHAAHAREDPRPALRRKPASARRVVPASVALASGRPV